MLFLVLPFSWMCTFAVADFIYRFPIESSFHVFSQPRINFNLFFFYYVSFISYWHFIFSVFFLVVCYMVHWKVDEMKIIKLELHFVCLPGHLPS